MIIVVSSLITACGFEIVDTGYRGVETRFGAVQGEPLPEGLHFYNPITTDIAEYSVQQETWKDKTPIFTKDTQRVDVEFAIVYYADPKSVHTLYRDVGGLGQLEEKIIKPVVLGSIKDAIGSVIADELVQKRELVTQQALTEVMENLKAKSVIVTDLQFTNLDFDDAYEKAVEQKVVAIQDAQKAVNETVRIKEQAKQTIETATAQAEAMRIQSAALSQNKGLVEYEIAKRWDGKLPVYMMGSSVPLLDLKLNK
jgi:regulator of protease activity HflC (stomatin/prohibitin superfamily)